MTDIIEDRDFWSLGQLFSVLVEFADDPTQAIIRMGGRICIPEDQSNHLHNHYRLILEKYPDATDLEVMKVVAEIDTILADKSRNGTSFDEWFWTNGGFERHPEWAKIRSLARAFLMR